MGKHRVSTLWAIVLAVSLLAAACGNGGQDTSGGETAQPDATEEATEAATDGETSADGEPITIGLLTSLSGDGGLYGPPVENTVQLAVDQLNEEGGILGRDVQVTTADDATDPATGAQAVERLITRDEVDVLISMTNSAVREAFISTVANDGLPFIYVTLYEGGACEPNMFSIGEVPPHYDPVYTDLVENQQMESFFMIGHDYVWPQTVLPDAAETIEAAGGSVAGQELVPFGTSDFGPIINKIQSSEADALLVALVGPDFGTFVSQWRQAGLEESTSLVSLTMTDDFAASLGADAEGIYGIFGYYAGLDTPENREFVDSYQEANPDAFPQNTLTEGTYDAVMAYAAAVEEAGTTDADAVNDALAGVELPDAPRGSLVIDEDTHHVSQSMYLLQSDDTGSFELVEEFPETPPGDQCEF